MGKKNSFWTRWSKPYRLTILEEQSFKERWQISISRFGVALTVGTLMAIVSAGVYALIAWSPLKEMVVPGYASEDSRLRAIQAEIRLAARHKTSLVIAHRLSTVVHAFEIVVLDSGRVVERGRHTDLLAASGTYAQMWALQQEEAPSA